MTIAVDLGRKATKQTKSFQPTEGWRKKEQIKKEQSEYRLNPLSMKNKASHLVPLPYHKPILQLFSILKTKIPGIRCFTVSLSKNINPSLVV